MDSWNITEGERPRGAIAHLYELLTLTHGETFKYSELCDSPGNEYTKHPDSGFTILQLKKPGPFGEMIDYRAGTEKIQSEPRAS